MLDACRHSKAPNVAFVGQFAQGAPSEVRDGKGVVMPEKPPEVTHEDPESFYWDLWASRGGSNRGKEYELRDPKPAVSAWTPMLESETWQKLLSSRSWVAIGVMRSLVIRARSKGHCLAKQEEIA